MIEFEQRSDRVITFRRQLIQQQEQIISQLVSKGLYLPDFLKFPSLPVDFESFHAALATGLNHPSMPIEDDEFPFYSAVMRKERIVFVSRLVSPNTKRLHEETNVSTVESDLQQWLDRLGIVNFNTVSLFMIAGIARTEPNNAGYYTIMQALRFLFALQGAFNKGNDLLLASTVRKENEMPNKPSSDLLADFTRDTISHPLVQSAVISQMKRKIPTDLWAIYVPNQAIFKVQSDLIAFFNQKAKKKK